MCKTISMHPAVDEVERGDWGGTKRYFVHLKPEFWFVSHETGHKSFNTVAEFRETTIEPRPEDPPETRLQKAVREMKNV